MPSDGSTGAAPAQGLVSQIWQHKCTKRLITGTALGTCFCAVDGRNTCGSHMACFVCMRAMQARFWGEGIMSLRPLQLSPLAASGTCGSAMWVRIVLHDLRPAWVLYADAMVVLWHARSTPSDAGDGAYWWCIRWLHCNALRASAAVRY